jgi:uncharacterized delta-60 repeat protein
MKTIGIQTMALALAGLALSLNLPSNAAPGDVDLSFDPGSGVDGGVSAIVVQPDGRFIIGGSFSTVKGLVRRGIARLHADGSADRSFNPGMGANSSVAAVALQPDGKILIGGRFTSVNGTSRNRVARLNADGTLDATFDPGSGVEGSGLPFSYDTNVAAVALQADGKVLIGGNFTRVHGAYRGHLARLNADGSLDTNFNASVQADSTSRPVVASIVMQPDGKILIGGSFHSVGNIQYPSLARLNPDGSLDRTFDPNPALVFCTVGTVALQADGKVLIGGYLTTSFQWLNTQTRIARLNPDGSLDNAFYPNRQYSDEGVYALALQPDGKVLMGGTFTNVDGVNRSGIARLHADGNLDTAFDAGLSSDHPAVVSIALPGNGQMLVGGYFRILNCTENSAIARLNADGSVDAAFSPNAGLGAAPSGRGSLVLSLALQPDAKVLIGGSFTSVNGISRNAIARLNPDGSLDTAFDPGPIAGLYEGFDESVRAIALQPDGQVLIGGEFTNVSGFSRHGIARLNADGSLDTSFEPGVSGENVVRSIALPGNGQVLIGGYFRSVDGIERTSIARLNSDGSLDPTFNRGAVQGDVEEIAVQPDGRILVGGNWVVAGRGIGRLNADGSPDTDFYADLDGGSRVSAVALQPDGKILMAGPFRTASVNGISHRGIARLHADGRLDTDFHAVPDASGYGYAQAVALQPDGKVLMAGIFTNVNGTTRYRIARLNPDGSLDTDFDPGLGAQASLFDSDTSVYAVALQPDGKVLMGGHFTTVNGVPRWGIARLHGGVRVPPEPERPQLRITLSGSIVILSWPASATGFRLQHRLALGASIWSDVATPPLTFGDEQLVVLSATAPQCFHRLMKP